LCTFDSYNSAYPDLQNNKRKRLRLRTVVLTSECISAEGGINDLVCSIL